MNRLDKKNTRPKEQKIIRHFSEDFKKTIVKEFDNKELLDLLNKNFVEMKMYGMDPQTN